MRVKLEDVCERGTSSLMQKDIVDKNGKYPVYGASGRIGSMETYQQEHQTVAVVKDGAGIGRTMLLPEKSSVIGTMQYLIPKNCIESEYLYYVVKYMHLEKYFSGATIPHIYFRDYKTEEFNLHDKTEQREIVSTLKRIEAIISNRQEQLTKLDELIKARFVEMFGDPVTNPFNWPAVELGQRCEIITGNTPSRAEPENYGTFIEWIKSDNINTPSTFLTPAQEYLSEVGFRKCRFVESGSLLMTCIAGSLNCIGNVAVTNRRVAFNQQINAITPTCDNVLYLYWLMILSKPAIHKTINMALKGILSKSQLSSIKFPFPSIECQNQFADFVAEVDKSKLFAELFAQSTCILAENRSK
ncbi:restriction endonuclease subunit S [Faecalibacterium tardum]|uniref:Restriction endonuclease subunit S n=1 Tax=Faecalibacterium tardum TaxID=3133156 RepID=A0ABV1AW41_9FIRM